MQPTVAVNLCGSIMEERIRTIIEASELHYTASKIIDSESFDMMINELAKELSDYLKVNYHLTTDVSTVQSDCNTSKH